MTTPTTNLTSQNNALIPQGTEQAILKPVSSVENIIDAYREYNRLKDNLLIEGDYQVIKNKKCIKKSGFRKLATAFGISTEIVRENRINFEKYFVYEITVRATSPNGRFSEACASCASNEKEFSHLENDVRATAQTRGTNRAIADLIGSWEVSAEELNQDTSYAKQESKTATKATFVHYHETPEGKKHYANMQNRFQKPITKTEDPKTEIVDTQDLEESEPHMKGIVHKNNKTCESPELMTVKQKNYLIKLIEIKYPDEQTRANLYNRLLFLTKKEANSTIQKLLVA